MRTRFLTTDEQARLLAHMPAGAKHDAAVFLFETGARVSEALKLSWADVARNPALDAITFTKTKGGKVRTVPLTTKAKAVLVQAKEAGRHRPFDVNYRPFYNSFKAAVAAAGLNDGNEVLTVHHTRHSCASRLVQRGASIYLVAGWLGHSSVTMSQRYAHLSVDSLRPLAALLEQTA